MEKQLISAKILHFIFPSVFLLISAGWTQHWERSGKWHKRFIFGFFSYFSFVDCMLLRFIFPFFMAIPCMHVSITLFYFVLREELKICQNWLSLIIDANLEKLNINQKNLFLCYFSFQFFFNRNATLEYLENKIKGGLN